MSIPSGRLWRVLAIRRLAGPGGPCQFAVTLERGADVIADLHVEAKALLSYRAFREHVLTMSGRLVRFAAVEAASDPDAAWLDVVQAAMPDEPPRRPATGFNPSPPPRRQQPQLDGVLQVQEIGGGD